MEWCLQTRSPNPLPLPQGEGRGEGSRERPTAFRRFRVSVVVCALAAGCAMAPLSAPEMGADWKIQQGQAVWNPKPGQGIAGELLVATNRAGDFVVEFA